MNGENEKSMQKKKKMSPSHVYYEKMASLIIPA